MANVALAPSDYASSNQTLCVAAFWSLNYEEQFYLVIGAIMVVSSRLGWPIMWGVLALMIPAFAWNLTHPSISYGFFLEYWVTSASVLWCSIGFVR